ncbi:hypothetical protein [Actinoplanes sp. URMC 104]|uniref:hypothetical protein n=1 Tax=Actinoplanes sp. URMC 104 TaxID=3423409 RepID=UPI003F1A06F1
MTTTATPTRPPAQAPRPNLPKGVRWSNAWKVDGVLTESPDPGVEMPVNEQWELTGTMWVCPAGQCLTTAWTFEPVDGEEDKPACTRHLTRLVASRVDATDADPAAGAYARAKAHIRGVYERRRDAAVAAAQQRMTAAQQAVTDATRATAADMRGHVPSLAASSMLLAGGTYASLAQPWIAAAVGAGMCSLGVVAAYLAAWWLRQMRARNRADAKQARRDKQFAWHIAAGTLAAGVWLICSAGASVLPLLGQVLFTLLFGLLLTFAVNKAHWDDLWATRRRLKEMARLRAEAEARRAAEEAERLAQQRAAPEPTTPAEPDSNDPTVVGARMAAEWQRISRTQAAANAFPQMARTWIDPAKTQPVTAPIDGKVIRIGWEFFGQSEPGVLVARGGMQAPVVAAKDWLTAVLFDGRHDPGTVSLLDRPGGQANRFTLIVTDSIPLGEPVRWQGKAGVRKLPDGTILVHRGRALDGNDYHHPIYVPGQAFGGLDVGTRGGGKSAGTILYLLNCLAAGIFPFLFDPKQLVNYPDFIGIFPIGVTAEHRDAFLAALAAERKRREREMSRKPLVDEFGREVHGEARWDLRNGPPITHVWEEFHDLANLEEFVAGLVNHIRFERDAAMGGKFVTQGGGLADLSSSVLRGLLNQTELTTYRMDDHQARLAGRKDGAYTASDLPPLPGMCLVTAPEAPPMPMRTAYVPRTLNHPDSVFNTLWGRSAEKVLQLPPPSLPEATLEVFRRHGVIEIWERAQGPGGLNRLLTDAENEQYGGPSPAPTGTLAGRPLLEAADVLLAIVWHRPGCDRAAVDAHPAWVKGVGRVPDPSTVSKAVTKLDKAGKLIREGSNVNRTYRLTDKASADGERIYRNLFGAAEQQRQAEATAETQEETSE